MQAHKCDRCGADCSAGPTFDLSCVLDGLGGRAENQNMVIASVTTRWRGREWEDRGPTFIPEAGSVGPDFCEKCRIVLLGALLGRLTASVHALEDRSRGPLPACPTAAQAARWFNGEPAGPRD